MCGLDCDLPVLTDVVGVTVDFGFGLCTVDLGTVASSDFVFDFSCDGSERL